MTRFANEPVLELRRGDVRERALASLAELDLRLPLDVPIRIGGEAVGGRAFESIDPASPERVVAHAQGAGAGDVDRAVERATHGGREWAAFSARDRAGVLQRAAGIFASRRVELAALAVRECGKPWPDADGDVCEAIDFLRYYAQESIELGAGASLLQPPGEHNRLFYRPRGVVGVIAPWNFPLAIPMGMVAGALATGNAAVLKPAPQSPGCALAVVDALHQAGVPADALALLPGDDEPGRALVAHTGVHALVFTGSAEAGLDIIRRAAQASPGQRHVKHVIAEMGGKNAIIVDGDADLDDAVPAIVASAFGFAGQKCSAASQILVHDSVADALTARLAGAVATLRLGPPAEFTTDVGPVIDAESRARLEDAIALGDRTAEIVAQAERPDAHGFYVAPTILTGLPADSPLRQREQFGPILVIEAVPDVDAACDALEASPFALTGGLFSRSPATIARVAERLPVGNLYVNREITGAMVGRQPFGGGRLSGTGAKAGGPDYLRQFVAAHVVTENTMRHGLVV